MMIESAVGNIFKYLPLRISVAINSLPKEIAENINEIRLRRRGALSVTLGVTNLFLDEKGKIVPLGKAITVTDEEINDCIRRLTESSLYSFDESVAMGFIPLASGGRAGVCGKANKNGFSEIYSVNLRLNRFIPDVAKPLVEEFAKEGIRGTIVCSPPAFGKTTFLRSVAHLLSVGKGIEPKRVAIADERTEISVGIFGSGLLDVLSGMPKGEAITILTRTMSPEVIVCDEISSNETEAVLEAQNTGVSLIASAHCRDINELKKRGRMKKLLENDVFPLCVVLGYDGGYNCKIMKTEDFL